MFLDLSALDRLNELLRFIPRHFNDSAMSRQSINSHSAWIYLSINISRRREIDPLALVFVYKAETAGKNEPNFFLRRIKVHLGFFLGGSGSGI